MFSIRSVPWRAPVKSARRRSFPIFFRVGFLLCYGNRIHRGCQYLRGKIVGAAAGKACPSLLIRRLELPPRVWYNDRKRSFGRTPELRVLFCFAKALGFSKQGIMAAESYGRVEEVSG